MGIKSRPLLYLRAASVRHTEESGFGLLPTPMAQSRETTPEQTIERQKKYGGKTRAMYLENYLAMGMLFTPKANDFKNQAKGEKWKGLDLSSQVKELTGTNSRLNHQFVAEMMGFPADWTILPFLSGETKVSKPTVTP
jgi:hypothetical protein